MRLQKVPLLCCRTLGHAISQHSLLACSFFPPSFKKSQIASCYCIFHSSFVNLGSLRDHTEVVLPASFLLASLLHSRSVLCCDLIIVPFKIPLGAVALVDFNIPPMTTLSLILLLLLPGLVYYGQNEWLHTGQAYPWITQLNLRNQMQAIIEDRDAVHTCWNSKHVCH